MLLKVRLCSLSLPPGLAEMVLPRADARHGRQNQGVIDAQAEIAKSQKRLAFAAAALDKLEKQRAAPTYAEKRPAEVQQREAAKVDEWKAEMAELEKAIAKFEALKV